MLGSLFVGNSNLVALVHAAKEASGEEPSEPDTSFLWLASAVRRYSVDVEVPTGTSEMQFLLLDAGRSAAKFLVADEPRPTMTADYANIVREAASRVRSGLDQVVSCLFGHEHSVFSMFEHEVPFDFVLDDEGCLPPDDRPRQIVPRSVVERELRARMMPIVRCCAGLRDLFPDIRLAHVMPPPPIADEHQIRERPEVYVAAMKDYALAPPELRRKVYRLTEQVLGADLADAGVELLPAPPESQVDGYLAKECWVDSLHGNATYGRLVLEQLGAL